MRPTCHAPPLPPSLPLRAARFALRALRLALRLAKETSRHAIAYSPLPEGRDLRRLAGRRGHRVRALPDDPRSTRRRRTPRPAADGAVAIEVEASRALHHVLHALEAVPRTLPELSEYGSRSVM